VSKRYAASLKWEMKMQTRREFLADTTAFAAMLACAGLLPGDETPTTRPAEKAKPAASDRLNVAVLGVNGRGLTHVQGFAGRHGCVVRTICDPDNSVGARAFKHATQVQGLAPQYERDLRRVFDDKSIDIVSIATPNHWHALAAVWALQAGKHVYVEKPVSHNVREGRLIVQAARKYKRLCQAGTQSRSHPGMQAAMEFLRAGKLGKIRLARALCYKLRLSIGKVDGEQAIPKSIDYDLWCGPAPKKPLHRQSLHYDWHWQWDYGNGDLGNQGVHEMDKARWGLGKNELPRAVVSVGGRYGYDDDGETPNTQLCIFDYGDTELIFEVRGLPCKALLDARVGNIFYGSEGYLVCPSYDKAAAFTPKGELIRKFEGSGDHFDNFVQAIRANRPESLTADIQEGHLSSALCHLGNISYRLGSIQAFAEKKQIFDSDADAAESFTRFEEHLRGFKLPAEQMKFRLGRKLKIDAKAEKFVDDPEADKCLTREYRKPFAMPEAI
jgi:predicted dehydrogenase